MDGPKVRKWECSKLKILELMLGTNLCNNNNKQQEKIKTLLKVKNLINDLRQNNTRKMAPELQCRPSFMRIPT